MRIWRDTSMCCILFLEEWDNPLYMILLTQIGHPLYMQAKLSGAVCGCVDRPKLPEPNIFPIPKNATSSVDRHLRRFVARTSPPASFRRTSLAAVADRKSISRSPQFFHLTRLTCSMNFWNLRTEKWYSYMRYFCFQIAPVYALNTCNWHKKKFLFCTDNAECSNHRGSVKHSCDLKDFFS